MPTLTKAVRFSFLRHPWTPRAHGQVLKTVMELVPDKKLRYPSDHKRYSKLRGLARQNAGDVPGMAGDSFCLDFSCFVLCIKAKNEVGIGAKSRKNDLV